MPTVLAPPDLLCLGIRMDTTLLQAREKRESQAGIFAP